MIAVVESFPNCELAPAELESIELFRGIPPESLRQIAAGLRRKVFPPKSTLMAVEQSGEVVYMIVRGTVKVHIEQPSGENVLITILGPGEIVGELSLLDNQGRAASVVTAEEAEFLWMDRAAFRHALRTIPELTLNLARILASRLRMANAKIESLAALTVESRVARQIVVFAKKYGAPQPDGSVHIPIRLTQSDLSDMIGASREQTNKVLVSYRNRGIIAVDPNHHLTLLKADMLARRAASAG